MYFQLLFVRLSQQGLPHLPISCTLDFTHPMPAAFPSQPLDWHLASKTGTTSQYAETCDAIVRPLLGKDYSSTEEVNKDLNSVCKKITDAVNSLIQRKKIKGCNCASASHHPIPSGEWLFSAY